MMPFVHARPLASARARAVASRSTRDDADVEPAATARSAHASPVANVSIKRTTPRETNRVARTSASNKAARRTTRFVGVGGAVERAGGAAARRATDGGERFPFAEGFDFETTSCGTDDMIELVDPMLSEERKLRLENVLANRSFGLLPVMEAVYDVGNMLAVCRSTEALGIGGAAIVSSKGLSFKASGRTSGGALKWQHVEQFESTADALRAAKARGYRVLTTEFEGAYPMSHYDWTIPTAVVFGNEKTGVSEEARAMSDGGVFIPMFGWTESLNISVAAAMLMCHAVSDRIARQGFHGDLSDEEKHILRGVYMSKLIPNYAKQGYVEDLVLRFQKGQNVDLTNEDEHEDDCEEELDESVLLSGLKAAALVGRRTPPSDKRLSDGAE